MMLKGFFANINMKPKNKVKIFLSISYLMLLVEGSLGFLGPGLERVRLLIGPLGIEHEPFVP